VDLRALLRRIDWPVAIFLVAYHLALIVGLPIYFAHHTPATGVVVAAFVLLLVTEIGIGAAYHRFYSHRCYKMNKAAEAVLLFLATLAFQGSALKWSHDHRRHHAHVDTDEDPYSIRKGFFYAHMGWLFFKTPPIDFRLVRDLERNALVMFQHRWFGTLGVGTNAAVCAMVGAATGDWLGSFTLVWWTRLLVSHHLTWFINSLAHTWGSKTYSREHSAVDNFVIAFLTVGEGYHNYHHTFASDYRNGVKWYHFDPTKWTIFVLGKLGLATDLRRFSRETIERRLLEEDRRLLLDRLRTVAAARRAEFEKRVHELADAVQEKHRRIAKRTAELRQAGRDNAEALRGEIRSLRAAVRRDMRDWSRLCETVLSLSPAAA
jgi:stearoyl-CoA desaturase (delta-9 desaturase)